MSDAIGAARMMGMGTMPRVLMMPVMISLTMGSTFASLHIVLQAKNLPMMVMGQDRCRQHHYADYH